jgi:hypothetical protein
MVGYLVHELVGRLWHAQGVHGEHSHVGLQFAGDVQHHHALGLEGSDDGQAIGEGLKGPSDHVLGFPVVEFYGDLTDLEVVKSYTLRQCRPFLSTCRLPPS